MSQAGFEKKIKVKVGGSFVEVPATTASMDAGGDVLDTTTFMSGGNRSRIYGIRDWSMSMTLVYDTDDVGFREIRNAWTGREDVEIMYLPDGEAEVGVKGVGVVETFSVSGSVDDLANAEVTIQANGVLEAHP